MDKSTSLKPIKNVSLYGSRSQEGHVSHICRFIDLLIERRLNVWVEKKLAGVLSDHGYRLSVHGAAICSRLPEQTEAAVSIGGDGTFLRTVRWLDGHELPIIGINTGHLGFLADNSIDDAESIVDMLAEGRGMVERRFALQAVSLLIPEHEWPYAINEVALLKGDTSSMIKIRIEVDGYFLAEYSADGLILATPTGSTAYNLSVGGPILTPSLENIILSPIAPHTLTLRPVVVSGDSVIKATITGRSSNFRVSIDGRSFSLPCGSELEFHKASHSVLTIRRPDGDFASTLRNKLFWGV